MKLAKLCIVVSFLFLSACSESALEVGATPWSGVKQFGSVGQVMGPNGAAADSSGNVYVAGVTTGELDGQTITGSVDAYLVKYDSSGTRQWTRFLGASGGSVTATRVGVDSNGNVVMVGSTDRGLNGNVITGTTDFFVAKYSSEGSLQWVRQMGAAAVDTAGADVAIDTAGDVLVAGYTGGGLDGHALIGTLDAFIVKYDSSGTKQWSVQKGVAGADTVIMTGGGGGVATDSSGNVYATGTTYGDLDGNGLTGASDAFLLKYNSSGAFQWVKQYGVATKDVQASAIAVDSSDNIVISGTTNADLDGNTFVGTLDIYVRKYDSSGTKLWTREIGGTTASCTDYHVGVDPSGNIYTTGYVSASGGDSGIDGTTIVGGSDAFLVKYDSSGVKQWSKQIGVSGATIFGDALAANSSGEVFLAASIDTGLLGNGLVGVSDTAIIKFDSDGNVQ